MELFLFQGQKGDPGLSPGKAHDGAKVGFQGPQCSGKRGSGNRHALGRALLAEATAWQRQEVGSRKVSVWFGLSFECSLCPRTKPKPFSAVFWGATYKTNKRFCLWTHWVNDPLPKALYHFLQGPLSDPQHPEASWYTCPGSFQQTFKSPLRLFIQVGRSGGF